MEYFKGIETSIIKPFATLCVYYLGHGFSKFSENSKYVNNDINSFKMFGIIWKETNSFPDAYIFIKLNSSIFVGFLSMSEN